LCEDITQASSPVSPAPAGFEGVGIVDVLGPQVHRHHVHRGPIDEQVRKIVGPQGVKYAIDPVAGQTGTEMYKALGDK
jgi:NADPH:quinone reductase-like Zn-dependent oxidoreductase